MSEPRPLAPEADHRSTGVRRRWGIRVAAYGILAGWMVGGGFMLHYSFALSKVETNSFSSLLPAGAPSTRALKLADRFEGSNRNEAIAVWRGPGRATVSAAAQAGRSALSDGHIKGLVPAGQPILAPDGDVAFETLVVSAGEAGTVAAVARARSVLAASAPSSVRTGVTGPAAFQSDLLGSINGVNATLLSVTALLVVALLVGTYGSPVLWILPLAAVGFAELLANCMTYFLARGLPVTGESVGLLTVLVFGSGTDYALLITSRYREELSVHSDHVTALTVAWRRTVAPISASAATVIAALSCLLLAKAGITHSLGLVGTLGIASSALAMLTAYPALLIIVGPRIFWPREPHPASGSSQRGRFWNTVGHVVARRPRLVWVGGVAVLLALCSGLFVLHTDLTSVDDLPATAPSVQGMDLLAGSVPLGVTAPGYVVVRPPSAVDSVRGVVRASHGVLSTGPVVRRGGLALFQVVFSAPPLGSAGLDPVSDLAARLHRSFGTMALLGGQTAQDIDTARASKRDLFVVGLAALGVTVVVLCLLLRALAGPLLVALTVVLSFGATLGAVALFVGPVLDFPGVDPSVPVLSFVFLVSLGIDYNIFLMTRAREELVRARDRAIERTVAATGRVLTSAGLILAGTFSTLLVLPLVPTREIGLVVAIGVLLDALFVRSVVLPALVLDTGHGFWWPTRLAQPRDVTGESAKTGR